MWFKTMQRNQNSALVSKKKIGGNHAFSVINSKASIWEKTPYIALYFTAFLDYYCLIISKKCVVTPNNSPC